MSTSTIKVASLESTRDQLKKVIDKLDTANNKALNNNVITSAQQSQFHAYVQDLENELAELNVALINSIIDTITVPSDSPAARIRSSIDELNIAIDSIQDTKKLITKIVMAISSIQSFIDILS